jgi:hypothetical protein
MATRRTRRRPPRRQACVHEKPDIWLCRCECGREMYVCGECLRSGRSTACPDCERKDAEGES